MQPPATVFCRQAGKRHSVYELCSWFRISKRFKFRTLCENFSLFDQFRLPSATDSSLSTLRTDLHRLLVMDEPCVNSIFFLRTARPLAAISLLLFLTLPQLGCSRDTAIFEEKSLEMVLPISTDGRVLLPNDFYDQSVGRAKVETQLDGVSATSKAIRFQTQGGANSPGAYNGSGVGSRALLGIGTWHGRPLSALSDLRWEAKSTLGAIAISMILQIDLKCNGGDIAVVEALSGSLATPVAKTDGYFEYRALLADAVWISLKTPVLDPTTSAELLSTAIGSPKKLSDTVAAFPAACLKNVASGAASLPKNIPTAAILWSLGDDANTTAANVFVRRFQVGTEEYKDLE